MCSSNSTPNIDEKPSSISEDTQLYIDLLSPQITHKTRILPATNEIFKESIALSTLAFPIALTALVVYTRSILSMLFLGRLGKSELAAGSLAIAFANITGYSVLSGLALGAEPICAQAFGAKRLKLLSVTLFKSIIFLLAVSIPIAFLWLNVSKLLLCLKQDAHVTRLAHTYLFFTLPDLITNSMILPIRIYLRAQGITYPLTIATLIGAVCHFPLNVLLVTHLKYGVAGVAAASAASNLIGLFVVVVYIWLRDLHAPTWSLPSRECFTDWMPLIRLAAPSCVSVCLEWWWYEIMIVLCGFLVDPNGTVAAMGVLIQTTAFIYVFPSSLSYAVSTRVGNELGANRPNQARVSAAVSIMLSALMGLSAMLFAFSMRNTWARMFSGDATILRLTSIALPILGLCELGNCPQTVACGVVRGTARQSTAANVNMVAFYLVGMPVAVGLGFFAGFGFRGLWLGLLAAQFCCAGLMLFVIGGTDWSTQAVKAQTLTCTGGDEDLLPPSEAKEEKEPLIYVV